MRRKKIKIKIEKERRRKRVKDPHGIILRKYQTKGERINTNTVILFIF